MTVIFVSVTPEFVSRIPVESTFIVIYDSALDPLTVITQNIIFEDSILVPIEFDVSLSSDGTEITINPVSNLSNDEVYTLTLTTSILELASPGDAIAQKDLIFITNTLSDVPVVDLSTDGNINDVFFESKRIADVFDIRDVINNGSKYNFAYTPTFFDEIEQTYFTNNPAQLTFDNQSFIKEQFRNQFLLGFEQYLTNISDSKLTTAAQFLDIERAIYPSAEQINNSPGLVANIKFLAQTYSQALGYHFIEVVPDPVDEFVYYVSTNLPKKEWRDTIRDLTHPISWKDVYVEVAGPETTIGTFTTDYRTDIFTSNNHGLEDGQLVHVITTDTLPTPLTILTNYYIITATTNTFQLSLTSGGSAINLTDNGTDTHSLKVLQYFQTEQYDWTDSYLFGTPTNKPTSVNEKSFRKGFYVKGNSVAYIVPQVDSSDPPDETPDFTVDSETQEITWTAPADYTNSNVVNYSQDTVLQESGTDGRVLLTGGSTFLTDVDLTAYPANGLADSLLFILLSEGKVGGENIGYYTIVTNTALISNNSIVVAETFPLAERDTTFEIHTVGKDVPLSELLAVLNQLQLDERFVFSYLQAEQSGALNTVSRLTFDVSGDLQLVHVVGSGLPFTFTEGDVTFQYESDTNPILFVTSTNFTTTEFTFGNVELENTVSTNTGAVTPGSFQISQISAPDSDGLQLITFESGEDISAWQPTHQITISDADSGNNGTFSLVDVDVIGSSVTIDNPSGSANVDTSTGASAVHATVTNYNVWTYILPNTFSFDQPLFNGYAIYFNLNLIDPGDITSACEFDYKYAVYLADIVYPDDFNTSLPPTSGFDSLETELQDETGNNFQKRVENGNYKMYTAPSGGFDVDWVTGNFIYEYEINSSGGPSVNNGTLFGVIERGLTSTSEGLSLIVNFFGSNTDFDNNKYYSNVKTLYNTFIISGADQVDMGSEFTDLSPTIEFDRKIILGFNVPDFDTYTWISDVATETISTDEQFVLFGDISATYNITLQVDEDLWVTPITLAPTLWTIL